MPLPEKVSGLVKRVPFYKDLRQRYDLDRLRRAIAAANPLNVVIGGGQRLYDGWVFTDKDLLDIANPVSWQKLFVPNSIDRILCEHVLEHLSIAECRVALAQCGLGAYCESQFRIAIVETRRTLRKLLLLMPDTRSFIMSIRLHQYLFRQASTQRRSNILTATSNFMRNRGTSGKA